MPAFGLGLLLGERLLLEILDDALSLPFAAGELVVIGVHIVLLAHLHSGGHSSPGPPIAVRSRGPLRPRSAPAVRACGALSEQSSKACAHRVQPIPARIPARTRDSAIDSGSVTLEMAFVGNEPHTIAS